MTRSGSSSSNPCSAASRAGALPRHGSSTTNCTGISWSRACRCIIPQAPTGWLPRPDATCRNRAAPRELATTIAVLIPAASRWSSCSRSSAVPPMGREALGRVTLRGQALRPCPWARIMAVFMPACSGWCAGSARTASPRPSFHRSPTLCPGPGCPAVQRPG